jgi:hypothetical protein
MPGRNQEVVSVLLKAGARPALDGVPETRDGRKEAARLRHDQELARLGVSLEQREHDWRSGVGRAGAGGGAAAEEDRRMYIRTGKIDESPWLNGSAQGGEGQFGRGPLGHRRA